MANISGLWSTKAVNRRPSNRNLKCQEARKSPMSSLSKVLYFLSLSRSFLLKKANGCQALPTHCSHTAPTASSEASVVRATGAMGDGCASGAALARAAFARAVLAASKALVLSGDQSTSSVGLLPCKASYKGRIRWTVRGRKQL